MKKLFLFSILIVFILSSCVSSCDKNEQEGAYYNNESMQQHITIEFEESASNFLGINLSEENQIALEGGFRVPIGWSENGYFATGIFNHRPQFGWDVGVFVRDLRTNTLVRGFLGNDRIYSTFDDFLNANAERIMQILEQYSIEIMQEFIFQPISNLNSLYGLRVEHIYDFFEVDDGVYHQFTDIIIMDNNNNQKTIYPVRNAEVEVLFFIKSPFEERVVFYIRTTRFDRGSTSSQSEFIGFDLSHRP